MKNRYRLVAYLLWIACQTIAFACLGFKQTVGMYFILLAFELMRKVENLKEGK